MPENRDDRMMLTLDALRRDVERTPLADSLTVRRRGEQRTRRQAIGGAVAVIALVASAAGIYGGLDGDDPRTAPPAITPTPTHALAAQPLVQPADVGTVAPYSDWQVSPDPVTPDTRPSLCVPDPSTLAAAETQSRLLYGDLDATVDEHVLRFSDGQAAQSAADQLTQSFANCEAGDAAEVSVDDRQPQDVAAQGAGGVPDAELAVHASRMSTPVQAGEVHYYELGVVRDANVLVILQWSSGPLDGVDWVWDADRLQTALDRAVSGRS